MPDFEALILSVNQNIGKLEEELEGTQEQLEGVNRKLDRLPQEYIPRTEAEIKADRVKKALAGGVAGLLLLGGCGLWINSRFVTSCRDSRDGIRQVITVAVADRQPLPTTSPEAAAAIEQVNATQIRPLREKLLSLDGTQPSKC